MQALAARTRQSSSSARLDKKALQNAVTAALRKHDSGLVAAPADLALLHAEIAAKYAAFTDVLRTSKAARKRNPQVLAKQTEACAMTRRNWVRLEEVDDEYDVEEERIDAWEVE
ncbi:hypothetical protein AMAG_15538 [Allomyces macrogynus ATCC 38327]|uniref:Uncharacterized protein n=1 Tax=Allomyces macrogynus (strain ATCC 38327) TaxID=578462 RepID=A0A0L0T968_ALLM3|nr:hypothetical protein AMAG_15538 [Allomyces macrogynus ATCC 38327]|eukprot:KNE71297.1 hypothetical protein AMAG_15538 [Allomyces macrogynus ATCC 38327]